MKLFQTLVIAATFVGSSRLIAQLPPDQPLITIKLIRDNGEVSPVPTFEFDSCESCSIVHDPAYERSNPKEFILAFRVPKSRAVGVRIAVPDRSIKRVILEDRDLPFSESKGELQFVVPSQIADRINSAELQTHLYWRGVELRFEHGDPVRKAGRYERIDFPAKERAAASNIQFALLESIWRLGLDSYVDQENLGRLFLMGFDTNYPHGHEDFPPHFHLTLWLPSYKANGSLIPHIYLDKDGAINKMLVGVFEWKLPSSFVYKPGEVFTSLDGLGRPLFNLAIDADSTIKLARFDGTTCSIKPLDKGFVKGASVACPSFPTVKVSVLDDLQKGTIFEFVDDRPKLSFNYDPDTGAVK